MGRAEIISKVAVALSLIKPNIAFDFVVRVLKTPCLSGAIIGDGDRKSRDSRAPMIWDNFSIFRTNCAILMSYIRADSRTCQGLSRGCCHVA